ncbi:3-methyladenine DNA glycosylase [Corynebacterium sp. 335C]
MSDDVRILGPAEWRPRAGAHAERADRFTADHLARRSRGERHPVEDFLFEYYPVRPAQLRRWWPGAGYGLADAAGAAGGPDGTLAWRRDLVAGEDGVVTLDLPRYLDRRGDSVRYVRDLLAATLDNPARFDCFGLHEWAMVYRTDRPRHPEPLRLGRDGTDAVVDGHRRFLGCTHFDAFRFFTDAARPLNARELTREGQPACEQAGCLHATMDLYKWAAKLGPLVPGETWLDCFELARDVRALDMAASPYDLRDWGVEPVRIETAEGKAEYVERQRGFSRRAEPLRRTLIACADYALSRCDVTSAS